MTTSRSTVVGLAAATLLLAACGQVADEEPSSLQPPQPVRAVASPSGTAATSALVESDAAMSMPAFVGFTYEASGDLPPLPTASTGYRYPPGATVDPSRVAEIAAVLGVDGEPVPGGGAEVDGLAWRVGPDDGSAPQVTVGADAQLSVNYSPAWDESTSVRCAELVDPAEGAAVEDDGAGTSSSAGSGDEAAPPPVEVCEEPEPPANVPSAEEAGSSAVRLLGELGLDAESFELETYADEWSASVTAWQELGGVRAPVAWGFGFGGDAELQWMSGSLATPVATGPYPLIGLDEALQRLEEQSTWFGDVALMSGDSAVASDASGDEAATSDDAAETPRETLPVESVPGDTVPVDTVPVDTAPVDTVPLDTVPVETLPVDTVPVDTVPVDTVPVDSVPTEVAVLVDVRADLWWAWDEDGSVWLLPAYTFTDTEGRIFTVPAVTDEFLIIAEPVLAEPLPVDPQPGVAEPAPVEVPEPDVSGLVVGLTVDEATERLAADGWSLRVVAEDGEALAVTDDFVISRVNVEVVDGVVTAVSSIG